MDKNDLKSEKLKWEAIYEGQGETVLDPGVESLGFELYELIQKILPSPARILETGCGSGAQSLFIAKNDGYEVTLLDFSENALRHAEALYAAHGVHANFILGDMFAEGEPGYDLVYNLGVLEHYDFEAQVNAVKAMASHSRRFVAVAVPNKDCYWYWLWRLQQTSTDAWPYGKEVPLRDMKAVFEEAGLAYVGQKYIASVWTENFINALEGLSEEQRSQILKIHRSFVVQPANSSYLLFSLGVVGESSTQRLNWHQPSYAENTVLAAQTAAASDALAGAISSRRSVNLKNTTTSDREEQIAALNQTLAEREEQIVGLKESNAEYADQVANLSLAVAERDGQVVELSQNLRFKEQQLAGIMNSNSMRITSFARHLRRKFGQGPHRVGKLKSIAKSQVLGSVLSRMKASLMRQAVQSESANESTLSADERYLFEKAAQDNYIKSYIDNGMDIDRPNLFQTYFSSKDVKDTKFIIYVLTYPMELTQRPDHILRFFAENGYHCIIIKMDNKDPFVREIAPNICLTNLFECVIGYFSNRHVTFYTTYPLHSYICNHLRRSIVVYDVLDDLSVFSMYCEAMKSDHKKLLSSSDITLFSSLELLNKNQSNTKGDYFLVSNGVWVKDFAIDQSLSGQEINFKTHPDEYVIGYHGAISELLDWELLERLIEIPLVRIVLIGPIVCFDSPLTGSELAVQSRVLASDKVNHVQPVPYLELKRYLAGFDAGIVPFVLNEKTDPVSPLKLFEYMAMGLNIFATPTKTLLEYSQFINVADRDTLPGIVRKRIDDRKDSSDNTEYSNILDGVEWGVQMRPVISLLDAKTQQSLPGRSRVWTVDLINVNYYDWDGDNLFKGGAERYTFDLASMLKNDGWSPRIIQNANHFFEKDYCGIPVVGVQTDYRGDLRVMSKKYRDICKNTDLIIASPLDLACELHGLSVIGINHGIYWDHRHKTLATSNMREYKNIFNALKVALSVIAVDTNFINWVRTFDYDLGQIIRYIPNYYDGEVFSPTPKDFDKEIRILYPRRLYEARGIFLVLKAFEYLFDKYEDIHLHLVGQADRKDGKIVSKFIEEHNGRVIWEEFDMDEMYKVYQTSHIVLIPTMYGEGTSLSCLEAMASNNAVIASNVGGLPNLVVDGFNGFLINPTAQALIQPLEILLKDRKLISKMAANGVALAAPFEKCRWLNNWDSTIAQVKTLLH